MHVARTYIIQSDASRFLYYIFFITIFNLPELTVPPLLYWHALVGCDDVTYPSWTQTVTMTSRFIFTKHETTSRYEYDYPLSLSIFYFNSESYWLFDFFTIFVYFCLVFFLLFLRIVFLLVIRKPVHPRYVWSAPARRQGTTNPRLPTNSWMQ